jgi:hypothetical protein
MSQENDQVNHRLGVMFLSLPSTLTFMAEQPRPQPTRPHPVIPQQNVIKDPLPTSPQRISRMAGTSFSVVENVKPENPFSSLLKMIPG